jgi:hypothetical protein
MTARKKAQRFPIMLGPIWRPFLLPFGMTPRNCFAEVKGGKLHVRFGRLLDAEFPLEVIDDARPSRWPLWAGIGARVNFRGVVGLVGAYRNIVELRFSEPQRVRLVVPVRCERLLLSIEEPEAFLDAVLRQAPAAAKAA